MTKVVALAGLLLLAATQAQAEHVQCGPAEQIHATLTGEFGEALFWEGASSRGPLIIRLYRGPDGWTAVGVSPEGQACILDGGAKWREVVAAPGDPT